MTKPTRILVAAAVLLAVPASIHAAEATANWTAQCQKCHGADGTGQTPTGKMLKIKDLTDPAVQDALTDEAIAASITDGVKNDKGKMVMLPLGTKIAAEDIPALVAYVRTLRRK
jgi:cytochrome c553